MVTHPFRGGASHKVSRAREKFCQPDRLGAGDLLPAPLVEEAMREEGVKPYACFYTPAVTIWTFLTQVLGPDRCCRAAVAKLLAMLASLNECCAKTDAAVGRTVRAGQHDVEDFDPDTGPYCKARERCRSAC